MLFHFIFFKLYSTSKTWYEKTWIGVGTGVGDGEWGVGGDLGPVYDLFPITKGCHTQMWPTIELSPRQRQELHKHVAQELINTSRPRL